MRKISDTATLRSFFDKVRTSKNGCWEWQGAMSKSGYGVFSLNRQARLAHRVALWFWNREWPEKGLQVDHLCRNTKCVYPPHLDIVEPRDNVYRSMKTKLSDENLDRMRRMWKRGWRQVDLAKHFNMGSSYVSRLVRNEKRNLRAKEKGNG